MQLIVTLLGVSGVHLPDTPAPVCLQQRRNSQHLKVCSRRTSVFCIQTPGMTRMIKRGIVKHMNLGDRVAPLFHAILNRLSSLPT
jgi:hypothetical protein